MNRERKRANKIVCVEPLLDVDVESYILEQVLDDIGAAIRSVEWPPGSGSFTLRDEPGKKRGQGNGVKPIKERCMKELESRGWQREVRVKLSGVRGQMGPVAGERRPGPLDATKVTTAGLFGVEWETGNISSSHRAVNKMALGILNGVLTGGILILPTRSMYRYLTDRVGNFPEFAPYFPLWRSLRVKRGFLAVIAVEHDAVSKLVPRIPKGTNGRALW
ncbi:MAG: hypothetical protein QME70_00105 [Bacillota bacterium]|nr:hypothetical protein [Bacillota bacterium]